MSISHLIQNINSKLSHIDDLVDHNNEKVSTTILPVLNKLIYTIKEIISISIKNLDFLFDELIQKNFEQVLTIIDSSSDSIINYMTFLTNNSITDIKIISNNIDDLYQCTQIFFTSFQQIINKHSISESTEILQNWFGLESFLFSFCVYNQSTKEIPFFNTKIVNLYKNYEKINSIENAVSAVTSYCGTGKTICFPIILLCRSLRENINIPFFILSEPNPKKVGYFFMHKISKFVTIITNKDEFLNEFKNYNENHQKVTKIVFGIFDPYDCLCFVCNPDIIRLCRVVVDDIHQRSTLSDVLIAKIMNFKNMNLLTLPLNAVLMSSSISSSLQKLFEKSSIGLISLCESCQYEIVENQPIYDHCMEKIKTKIVPNEMIRIVNKMATINAEIKEGHILCYLPGTVVCEKAKNIVISSLINNEETDSKRKIVFLKTKFKNNEPLKDFYEKIIEEYNFNEKIREVNKYRHEFIYFLPLNYSESSDESLSYLVKNELPKDLSKINKLVFSASLLEPSINDKLSVVIDSGLIKENGFDYSISINTVEDIQASKEIMYLRKGKLGRSMKGLYIPIQTEKNIPEVQTPLILREDLTKNILLLKDININIENIKNLPDKPNKENIQVSLDNLIFIEAIDDEKKKITEFGHSILQFPFISIYYAAAMQIFKNEFDKDEENIAFFVSGYISTVITMSNDLFNNEMSEELSKLFVKESDIATIINALNVLLASHLEENEETRNTVESYGFSYSAFCDLKVNIQKIIDIIYPTYTIAEVLDIADEFIANYDGILTIIDLFILSIEQIYPNFTDYNYITFKFINESSGFDGHSSLIFNASDNLKFIQKLNQNSEISINKRPGWNGISIPIECYLFNITHDLNNETYNGFLVHRATSESKNLISTIMLDEIASNPYFGILLDIYFKDLNLTYFESDSYGQRKKSYKFHYSNIGDKVFVSFISDEGELMKEKILQGAKKIIKLLPFTPRSILILRSDGNAIIEITSLGTQKYNTSISTSCKGYFLDKKSIDYCLNNLNELAKLDSRIRICSLFVDESCEMKYFDQKNLYIINEFYNNNMPPIIKVILPQLQKIHDEIKQTQQMNRHYKSESKIKEDFALFQFPSDFIHPSLIRYQESLNSILKWFENFNQVKVYNVIGSRLLIEKNDAERIKIRIQNERETIKGEMDLNYVVVQIPSKIYEKTSITINEHQSWYYDQKFRTIVTTKEESEKVKLFIDNYKSELIYENEASSFIENNLLSKVLCCYLSCNNPDDPILTKYPITVFFKDGSYYNNKICHDCILDNFKFNLKYLFAGGKVDRNKVEGIMLRPNVIPSVDSFFNEEESESWPIIPLGLMVYALINDEGELSSFISAWLYSVEEFTIRVMMKNRFIWCDLHPHAIFDIVKLDKKIFQCKECEIEIASMQPDEIETLRRKEEKRLRDKENRVFQEVELQIRELVEEKMAKFKKAHQGYKIKNRQQLEDKMRIKYEIEIRNENYEIFRNDVLNEIDLEEKRKIVQEKRRKELEETKRKEDERLKRIEEERIRRYEASIQREVDYHINKIIEKQILKEETQTGNEINSQRRKEIEIEVKQNEEEIRNNVIQERKRLIDEEIKKVNERNYKKNITFISKLNKCPNCKMPIIKNGGCNYMHCRCGCNFMWG